MGSIVPLGLFEIYPFDILTLDRYEGYPDIYSKYYLPVEIENKSKEASIYMMNAVFDYHLPAEQYFKICLEGYADFGFDKEILNQALINTIEKIKIKKY